MILCTNQTSIVSQRLCSQRSTTTFWHSMDLTRFNQVTSELHQEAQKIVEAKRPAYTLASTDVLRNFKAVADRLGITPMQAWGVYFLKHIDSITSAAKDPNIPQAEAMIGRFADAMNYLELGFALMNETPHEVDQ